MGPCILDCLLVYLSVSTRMVGSGPQKTPYGCHADTCMYYVSGLSCILLLKQPVSFMLTSTTYAVEAPCNHKSSLFHIA